MSRSVSAPSSVTNTSPCWNGDIVPGSTLMYGSSLMLVTRMLRDSRIAARDAAAMPFPNEETTPPVTKTYLAIYPSRGEIVKSTGIFSVAPLESRPLRLDPVVGAMHDVHVLAHRPRDHLAVQRHVVDLGVVLGDRGGDLLLALRRIWLDARRVDQRVELRVHIVAVVVVAGALAVGAVQHRGEDRLRIGDRAAPAQHVGARVALRQAGEVNGARLRVDAHPQPDLGQHPGDRDADLLVVDIAVVRTVERVAEATGVSGFG